MTKKNNPIAAFDSGMGGISVLREMVRLMPQEDFLYYGDSANAPYGTKTLEEVRKLTIGHIRNLVENYHAKAVAVACNTATSAAVRILRKMYPNLPLVGVEPAIKPAVMACDHPRVLVMATPMTIREEKFQTLEQQYEDRATIYQLPCPGLMEYVEKGVLSGKELDDFLEDLLGPYRGKGLTGIVLGCTHYPFLKKPIRKVIGPAVDLFDGGFGTARELRRRTGEAGLLRDEPSRKGSVTFLNSSDDPSLIAREKELFSFREL